MKLLDVQFGLLPTTAPDDRSSLGVHLHHVQLGTLTRPTEDPPEDHADIAHQVHGVVMYDNHPRQIECFGELRLGRF